MTDMDRLIEVVAREISPETFKLPRVNLYAADYDRAFAKARAAILATLRGVREPTAEMIGEAGATVLNRYVGKDPAEHHYGTAGWAWETWQAMIDSLISDLEQGKGEAG